MPTSTREQQRDPEAGALLDAKPPQREESCRDDQQIGDELEPQPMPQHPERREQEGPEVEAVAHEQKRARAPSASSSRCGGSWTV